MSDILAQPWWQGVAGIAQILAALFAIMSIFLALVSILLAARTIKQAQAERHEAVAPDWRVADIHDAQAHPSEPSKVESRIHLQNQGWGPARFVDVQFEPQNGNPATSLRCSYVFPSGKSVRAREAEIPPGSQVEVLLGWTSTRELQGLLVVRSMTRLGKALSKSFSLRTHVDRRARGGANAECEVRPAA